MLVEALYQTYSVKLHVREEKQTIGQAIVVPLLHAAGEVRCPNSTTVKVQTWKGCQYSTEDDFPPDQRTTSTQQLLNDMIAPTWCTVPVSQHVKVLKVFIRKHEPLKLEVLTADVATLALQRFPTISQILHGKELLHLLEDRDGDMGQAHSLVDACRGRSSISGLLVARDDMGRTPLHLAVTRGDLSLCHKLSIEGRNGLAFDDRRNTPLMSAALAGRALIVRELLRDGTYATSGMLQEKNCELMTALQLAVVDEAAGNGHVVQLLVEAGAPIDALCWTFSPLMCAAKSGHHWAVETLLSLGADPHLSNTDGMTALDHARDDTIAQLVLDYTEGKFLPDDEMIAATRRARQTNGQSAKSARTVQCSPSLTIEQAFQQLGLPDKWISPFVQYGAYYVEVRKAWRNLVLKYHPDKWAPKQRANESKSLRVGTLEDELGNLEEGEEKISRFTSVMTAFETIESFYSKTHG